MSDKKRIILFRVLEYFRELMISINLRIYRVTHNMRCEKMNLRVDPLFGFAPFASLIMDKG